MDFPLTEGCLQAQRTDILLLAHAPLASAYASMAADMGLATSALMVFDMPPDMSREQAFASVRMLVSDRRPQACLVLVDLGGGASPFAVAKMLQDSLGAQARIVTGLNTPMLITALCHCQLDVEALARRAVQRGSDGIQAWPAVGPLSEA